MNFGWAEWWQRSKTLVTRGSLFVTLYVKINLWRKPLKRAGHKISLFLFRPTFYREYRGKKLIRSPAQIIELFICWYETGRNHSSKTNFIVIESKIGSDAGPGMTMNNDVWFAVSTSWTISRLKKNWHCWHEKLSIFFNFSSPIHFRADFRARITITSAKLMFKCLRRDLRVS